MGRTRTRLFLRCSSRHAAGIQSSKIVLVESTSAMLYLFRCQPGILARSFALTVRKQNGGRLFQPINRNHSAALLMLRRYFVTKTLWWYFDINLMRSRHRHGQCLPLYYVRHTTTYMHKPHPPARGCKIPHGVLQKNAKASYTREVC